MGKSLDMDNIIKGTKLLNSSLSLPDLFRQSIKSNPMVSDHLFFSALECDCYVQTFPSEQLTMHKGFNSKILNTEYMGKP